MGELLLEVRCEEIPARMLTSATTEAGTRLFEELLAKGLTPGEIETGFTPRRLVLVLKDVPDREPDREDLRERLANQLGSVRASAWGPISLALNPFASIIRELSVLYAHSPEVLHDDAPEAAVALLKDEGITHLFGNPGTTELPVMDALKDALGWSYREFGKCVFVTKFITGYDPD